MKWNLYLATFGWTNRRYQLKFFVRIQRGSIEAKLFKKCLGYGWWICPIAYTEMGWGPDWGNGPRILWPAAHLRADQGPIDQQSGPDVNIGSGDVWLKCRQEYTAEGDISIREEPSQGIRATSGGESRLERGGGVVSEEGGGGGGGGGVVVEVGGTWGMWEVGRVPLSVMTTPLHKWDRIILDRTHSPGGIAMLSELLAYLKFEIKCCFGLDLTW